MLHPIRKWQSARTLTCLLVATVFVGCKDSQTVSLAAEDFRFTPRFIRVNSSVPINLTIYNAGREVHEFDSPILIYAPNPIRTGGSRSSGFVLAPGQSLQVVVAPPPGTYLYICRRKGHVNMIGTLIVE
ncbi:cupredoxin domain-containing protein [Petrachloros mirabilis]